ncbi:hypothetical protein ACE3NQ_16470 [Paenibacillus terreus]|uniref:Uncharacterized protein n=1 Tax=Paenibacillus terreus TaxID=1387834 RepID=A0ABV5B9Z2_9BACL
MKNNLGAEALLAVDDVPRMPRTAGGNTVLQGRTAAIRRESI